MLLSKFGEVVRQHVAWKKGFLFQATCCQLVAFSVEAQQTLSHKLLSTVLPAKCCLVYVGLKALGENQLDGIKLLF